VDDDLDKTMKPLDPLMELSSGFEFKAIQEKIVDITSYQCNQNSRSLAIVNVYKLSSYERTPPS